jgi:hypothetical protein
MPHTGSGKEYGEIAEGHAGTICEPTWAFGEFLKAAQPTTH